MPAPDPTAQENALVFRTYALEGQVKTLDDATGRLRENQARQGEALAAQAVTLAKHDEQLIGVHNSLIEVKANQAALVESVHNLAEKVATATNRVSAALATFGLTTAGAAILYIASH